MRVVFLFFCGVLLSAAQGYRIDTVAGSGRPGYSGDGSSAFRAEFNEPAAVALDSTGRLYIADSKNNRIRRIEVNGTVVTVATLEQTGSSGVADIAVGSDGSLYVASGSAVGVVASDGAIRILPAEGLENVTRIAVESNGDLLVIDNGRPRRISAGGIALPVSTGLPEPLSDIIPVPGGTLIAAAADGIYMISADGTPARLTADVPVTPTTRLESDRWGDVYVSGTRVWKIVNRRVWVLAGTDTPGFAGDGASAAVQVNSPGGMAVDSSGNVFFADTLNQRIRVLRPVFGGTVQALSPTQRASEIWPAAVTLRWSQLQNAPSYDVYLGRSPDALTLTGNTAEATFRLPALMARTTYYWQIRTRLLPAPPILSPVFSFSTTSTDLAAADMPSNPFPSNFTLGHPTSFWLNWRGGGAIRYEVYVDENEYTQTRAGISEEPRLFLSNLKPETLYYWRVLAIGPSGTVSSPVWRFTTGPRNGYPWLVQTVAGTALPESDGLLASQGVLQQPRDVAADISGSIYFVEKGRSIRRVSPEGRLATLWAPQSGEVVALAADREGNVYVASSDYVTRIARNGQRTVVAGAASRRGFTGDDGPATQAAFNGIAGLAADASGILYIADAGNNRIRALDRSGIIRTVAGNGLCEQPSEDLTASGVPLCSPSELTADEQGGVFIYSAGRIFRLGSNGFVRIVAGTGVNGYTGDGGPGSEAQIGPVMGMAADSTGNLFFTDGNAMTIRRVDTQGVITTFAGERDSNGRAFGFAGDGLPATRARFGLPDGLAFDSQRNLIIADTYNNRVRAIDVGGFVRTLAGADTALGDRGNATSSYLFGPTDVAVDAGGFVYIADSLNHRIRRVSTGRFIETVAGGGSESVADTSSAVTLLGRNARDLRLETLAGGVVEVDTTGDVMFTDQRATSQRPDATQAILSISATSSITGYLDARASSVGGIVRGLAGELYVSDTTGHRVLRFERTGAVNVIAGNGTAGFDGDGGPAALAQVNSPRALSINPEGELFVAEFSRVRKITGDGRIITVLNENANGIAHDRFGNLYLTAGNSVYRLSMEGQVTRIALEASLSQLRGIAVSSNGEVYFTDFGQNLVRRLTPNVPDTLTITGGNNQPLTGATSLPQPLAVRLLGRTGAPVPGATVRFTWTSGVVVPFDIGSASTNADGVAEFRPYTAGWNGAITIRATVAGGPSVLFTLGTAQ